MQQRTIALAAASGLALALIFGGPLISAEAQQVDRSKPLEKRIETLEQIVSEGPFRNETVLARLDRVERAIKENGENVEDRARKQKDGDAVDAKTLDELKAVVADLKRQNEAFDRRLRAAEGKDPNNAINDLERSLKEMNREVDGQTAKIRDVDERIRRLESKVR